MGKHLRYDKDGNEVYFDHAVDAREGVQMGFFFETPPEDIVPKQAVPEVIEDAKPSKSKKEKQVASEVIEDDPKIKNINLDDEN